MNERNKSKIVSQEEQTLLFWRKCDIFKKTLSKKSPQGEFTFYDGPPFATGLPHFGHILSSTIKDVVGRYKTMCGYHVRRVWGWDCHGLPVESKVEEKLKLKTKKDIEAIGVARFNKEAKSMVLEYVSQWKQYVERIGRWVDFDHSYKTMDTDYMESVWWAIKTFHEKGVLYEGNRVLMYCPHCETPLAKAEIAMDNSYKEVTEEAVTITFPLKNIPNTSFLAWTTTPWTLPGNVALAVHPSLIYVVVEEKTDNKNPRRYILAKNRLEVLGNIDSYTIIEEKHGSELIGMEYEPLYPPFDKTADFKNAFHVYGAQFVTAEDGTGIVHTAVMYGEDDYELGKCEGLPMVQMLHQNGTYKNIVPDFLRGVYIKDAEESIKEDLYKRERLFSKALFTHQYPHCYRCGTPLIYNAVPSWFINIQKYKDRMIELNERINWIPKHLKEGRFRHILETAPDWTISRNRYWATPLPVWRNTKSDKLLVIGSVADLKRYILKSKNTYFIMRHGQAQSNVTKTLNTKFSTHNEDCLTDIGRAEALHSAKEMKKEINEEGGIDIIIASPFLRTLETAYIVAEEFGILKDAVHIDERLREIDAGEYEGMSYKELDTLFPTIDDKFNKAPPGGESFNDVRRRTAQFLYEIENRYHGKRILIVSHYSPLWVLQLAAQGLSRKSTQGIQWYHKAQYGRLDFIPLPHDEDYELDLHRPYIDDITLVDKEGMSYKRTPEVLDCWVESGSMPFAELHMPMENKSLFAKRSPADFITEYIAQTRTWFYYLHAINTILFDKPAFINVVTTGTILAADSSKMSKSKNNFRDPMEQINQYGADALRLYLLGSVVMQAEDFSFREEDVREVYNRVLMLLLNSVHFYKLFADTQKNVHTATTHVTSIHILDRWIRARINETTNAVTVALNTYNTIHAIKLLRTLTEDLSQWYIRRSRDRIRTGTPKEKKEALTTLQDSLRTIAILFAPFAPFIAEYIFQEVCKKDDPESVHLISWQSSLDSTTGIKTSINDKNEDTVLIADMKKVRAIASEVLMLRQKAQIKVRQPLNKLSIPGELSSEITALLADEVNVKHINMNTSELLLDTKLTDSLIHEGDIREFTRAIASARKTIGLSPNDTIHLTVEQSAEMHFTDEVFNGVSRIIFLHKNNYEYDVKLSFGTIAFSIQRDET